MTNAARYFDLVREMKDAYNHRLRLVESAKRPTLSQPRGCSRPRGLRLANGCADSSSTAFAACTSSLGRFRRQPHKTACNVEAQVVELRKTLPTFGSRRLIREFELRIGHNALDRIWREHGLMEKRRRKYQRKQDPAHIRAQWALFQQISANAKHLDDFQRYWTPAQQRTCRRFNTPLEMSPSGAAVLVFRPGLQRFGWTGGASGVLPGSLPE